MAEAAWLFGSLDGSLLPGWPLTEQAGSWRLALAQLPIINIVAANQLSAALAVQIFALSFSIHSSLVPSRCLPLAFQSISLSGFRFRPTEFRSR